MQNKKSDKNKLEIAVFGGGCFWCLEPIFSRIKGVKKVVPGYAGGEKENPTYKEVSTGETGHAEVIKVDFDASILTYEELLKLFFSSHDPTTLNRQGNDIGTQYRSIVLHTNNDQKKVVDKVIEDISLLYESDIVTEVTPLKKFYEAEEYHHRYFEKNPNKAYCRLVIAPKLKKVKESHKEYFTEISKNKHTD